MKLFFPFLAFCCTLCTPSLFADPWGKDADLCSLNSFSQHPPGCTQQCTTPLFGPFAEAGIWFHQEIISPADGPRSHYNPSSSQYTLDAMRKYGFFSGFGMGCDRLMRENDEEWVYRRIPVPGGKTMKYDPVP